MPDQDVVATVRSHLGNAIDHMNIALEELAKHMRESPGLQTADLIRLLDNVGIILAFARSRSEGSGV